MVNLSSIPTNELQALLGALPDAVLITGRGGRIEFLNRAAEELTRRRQEDAEGRPLAEILPLGNEVDASPMDSPAAACLRQRVSVGPLLARVLNGRGPSHRVVEVSAGPILDSAVAVGAILVVRDVTRARLEARQLAHRATHDALTGLVNRAEFQRRLRRAFAGSADGRMEHVLGFLDLDGFKAINDACGHLSGDELLRQFSAILRSRMRSRDTVARLGGDEFGILLEHCTPARGARIANEIRKAISRHTFVCNGKTHRVGVSVGIVPLQSERSPREALRAADSACYSAKRKGGNRVQLHTSGMLHSLLEDGRPEQPKLHHEVVRTGPSKDK
jgi:diguanylate cyclase (GGDEF)-like protein/PAS domain S-box-containing protein